MEQHSQSMEISPNRVYGIKEVARLLQVGVVTVYELVRSGEIKHAKRQHKRSPYKILGKWVIEYLEQE